MNSHPLLQVVRAGLDARRVRAQLDLTTVADAAFQRAWADELEMPAPSSGGTAMASIVVPVAAAGLSGGADWLAEDQMPSNGMPTASRSRLAACAVVCWSAP